MICSLRSAFSNTQKQKEKHLDAHARRDATRRRDVRVPDSRSLYLGCPGPAPFLVGNRWKRESRALEAVDESTSLTLTDFRESPLESHGTSVSRR